jgi:hypothetical protein
MQYLQYCYGIVSLRHLSSVWGRYFGLLSFEALVELSALVGRSEAERVPDGVYFVLRFYHFLPTLRASKTMSFDLFRFLIRNPG